MITRKDLQEAIAECEGQKNPNANTCIKLAAFYTIRQNLYPDNESESKSMSYGTSHGYSYSAQADTEIGYESDTEFSRIIQGMNAYDVLSVIDELMETLQIVNPRLYNGVIRKLNKD